MPASAYKEMFMSFYDAPAAPPGVAPEKVSGSIARGARSSVRRHAPVVARDQVFDALALLLEGGELGPLQLAPAREADFHGIDEAAVDQHLEVQMRAGGKAGRADISDHLALAHALPGLQAARIAAHMAVGCLVAVGMPERDGAA